VLFAQQWGVVGVRTLTFTVIPTPFMRTRRRVGAGLVAHIERSLIRTSDVLESQLSGYAEKGRSELNGIPIR
jgi:hypothetical protein